MPRATSPLRNRVIFVVGARRSGTNWLERILTAHPEIVAVPTESYLFSHGVQPLTERFQHSNPGTAMMGLTFVQRETMLDALRNFIDPILLETLEREDPEARYIVERTPWHASHLPLIADVFPDAWVINIIRDGHAVARSLVSMPWGPATLEDAAAEWAKAVQDARNGAPAVGDRYIEVVYETLLSDPRRHTTSLFATLGLELSDEHWAAILAEAGSEFNVDPASPGLGPDKWRKELSPAEVRAIERVAGPQLVACGYDLIATDDAPETGRITQFANGRLRDATRKLARPRHAIGATLARASARRLHAVQHAHNGVVSRFERFIAAGDEEAARELLSPKLWARIDDRGSVCERRGHDAVVAIVAALAEHRARGMRVLSGEFHSSAYDLTTVASYELDDRSRWIRTLVYRARGGALTGVALYRYEVRGDSPIDHQ
jgi:hypothetical protein